MEKKESSQMKSNVISGMSSTVGAAVGVVVGSAISSEANAAEISVIPEEQEVEVVASRPSSHGNSSTQQNDSTSEPPIGAGQIVSPDPPQKPHEPLSEETTQASEQPTSPEAPQTADEVEVISYETITIENGSQMDVAVVRIDDQLVTITDTDQDGVADTVTADLNNNGQIEEGEITDVSDQNIAMPPLQEAVNAGMENFYVGTDDVDYINDANVDDYMA